RPRGLPAGVAHRLGGAGHHRRAGTARLPARPGRGGPAAREEKGDHRMIEAGDLRPGNTVERNGELLEVLDFAHIKMGRGTAIVRAKFRNVNTGAVTEETFRPEEKFGRARIERTEAQFLYKDADSYVIMDNTTYDQFPLSAETMGDTVRWLKENDTVYL